VVIGRHARHVKAAEAAQYIFGFTCVNDVTARDLQKKDGQWTGPKALTPSAGGPRDRPARPGRLERLRVRTFVDGEKKQDAPIHDMIFTVPFLIEFITRFMTLEPVT